FFFFQAEDGIRDDLVTGVQTCALPISETALAGAIDMVMNPDHPDGCLLVHGALAARPDLDPIRAELSRRRAAAESAVRRRFDRRSEERRVGKGGGARGWEEL